MALSEIDLRAMVHLEQMILAMKERGSLTSDMVEEAFRRIPRHLFVKGESVEVAYVDAPIPIEERGGVVRSSVSAPSTVAAMLEQLRVKRGQNVFEIGAGTGYNAALMAHLTGLKGHVTTIEINARLAKQAAENLKALGIDNVEVVTGDGALGYTSGSPYDRIMLTVGAADIAPAWIEQLAMGGVLLVPLWVRGEQLTVALKKTQSGLVSESIRQHGFVRLRGPGAGSEHMAESRVLGNLAFSVEGRGPARGKLIDSQIMELQARRSTGVTTTAQSARTGLMPWLALHDTRHCLIDWRGSGAPPIPMLYAERYGSLTSALVGRGELVVLGITNLAGGEVFVASQDAKTRLVDAVIDLVRGWDSAGQPTLDDLRLMLDGGDQADCTITLKSGMVLGARWVRGTPVTKEANRARGGSPANPAR